MDDAALVGVIQALADLGDDVQLLDQRVWQPGADDLVQILPLDQLHGNERHPAFFAHVVNGDDVRMPELACRLGFAVEALHQVLVVAQHFRHGLNGDRPAQERILGFVNHTHGSLAEFPDDLILADFF